MNPREVIDDFITLFIANKTATVFISVVFAYIGWILGRCSLKRKQRSAPPESHIAFPHVSDASFDDLVARIKSAKYSISIFGLTRNFFAKQPLRDIIVSRAKEIRIKFFLVEPGSTSRKDRYRVEPIDAAFNDEEKYKLEVVSEFEEMKRSVAEATSSPESGLDFFYFNFPCQTAIERFDDSLRVSIYGIDKQGRDSPIWVYTPDDGSIYEFFKSQIDWVEKLSNGYTSPKIESRGIRVRPAFE